MLPIKSAISDHIELVSRNGAVKAVPCWQIRQWIETGRFSIAAGTANLETIGYAFKDEAVGNKDYELWIADEARKRQKAQFAGSMPREAEGGIAEAHLKAVREHAADVFTPPPIPPVPQAGGEGAAPHGKPQDVI